MGVLFFFFICFPVQQFNEILEYWTDNPQQQPCNPWFVMSSMLYCKQTQAAYQGSNDLLSYARSLPGKMGKKIFLPLEDNNLKTDFEVKEHLNTSETKSRLYRTRVEWWCFSYSREVTVTAWDWILLKTIILFPSWPLGELFIAEKRLFNQSTCHRLFSEAVVSLWVYFWSVFCGAYIGQRNMIQYLFSSALSGVGVHLSRQRGPVC